VYAAFLVAATWTATRRAEAAAARVHALLPFRMLCVWTVLGGRSLAREALRLADALDQGDLDAARRRAPALVGRDPAHLDAGELARAAVESVAENTGDAIVAPLFWCAVAGAPAAAAYRAANTLDAMVGHRSERYLEFGWAAARLDDAANWVPARLGVALVALVAGSFGPARTARRDGRSHPSPNAGLLEAAFAGALGVRLGGRNVYDGRAQLRPALGDGRPPAAADIRRAVRLSRAVSLASVVVLAGIAGRLER
jgi:adenosylcobinamide-phosphate synthase